MKRCVVSGNDLEVPCTHTFLVLITFKENHELIKLLYHQSRHSYHITILLQCIMQKNQYFFHDSSVAQRKIVIIFFKHA